MKTQPKAIRLADLLDTMSPLEQEAAVEMRRLYAENQALRREKADAYDEGVSHGIYKARNALTDMFRL